jgi:hypothetical protein
MKAQLSAEVVELMELSGIEVALFGLKVGAGIDSALVKPKSEELRRQVVVIADRPEVSSAGMNCVRITLHFLPIGFRMPDRNFSDNT